jgi:3',5'-cyclic AMP phosphodiesterase CpdA
MPLPRMPLRSVGFRPASAVWTTFLFGLLPALGSAQQRPFGFMLLSDPQSGMYSEHLDFRQETANFEFAAAAVNRLKPAFIVVLGDLVNKPGDPAQISEYLRISRTVEPAIPVYQVAGNREDETLRHRFYGIGGLPAQVPAKPR